MGATLDLYIDTSTGELLQAGAGSAGDLPTLTRNDSYTLRLRLLEKKPDGTYDDIDLTGATLKAAIGDIEEQPSAGEFKLICNGVTSTNIPYNATAVCVYNAVSNNVSTVSIYGDQFLLTASQPNTAMSFTADSFTLFPASTVIVGTRRNPVTSVNAQQTVRLEKNPAVFSDTFTTSPTADEIKLTKIADGSATQNETYELEISPSVRGGAFSLVFGPNSTTGVAIGTSAITFQNQFTALTNVLTGNASIQDNGKGGYSIQFVGSLRLTNISTAVTLDASGVDFIPFKQTTLSLNTSELADYFTDEDADTITPTLEIELTQNGTPKTILQKSVTIRKDLITTGSFVPSTGAQYYTKGECDALFVEDATTGTAGSIDAANFRLKDSGGTNSLLWNGRELYDASGSSVVSWGGGLAHTGTALGFYSTTPTGQPSTTNVLSALTNLGLIASTVTLGNVVSQSSVNVDAIGQDLYAGGQISVDWGNRSLKNSSGTTVAFWNSTALSIGQSSSQINLTLTDSSSFNSISVGQTYGTKIGTATAQKLGFWNSTPVTQPNQDNVVTALRGCGLLAGGPGVSTFGVLPLSPRTLTTTASINFGSISGHSTNYADVTLTGAAVNDIVLIGNPAAVSNGVVVHGNVYKANTVSVHATNGFNNSNSLGAETFRITVIGY